MTVLGHIGIGIWGKNHLRNFATLPGCTVKAACDRDAAVLEKIRSEYRGEIGCTTDPSVIMRDPKIDAVVITTLPDTHADLAVQALEAGKHVFIEKPLAMSVREGERIKKAVEASGKICLVGHILLYHPAVRMLKKQVDEGALGRLYYMYSTRVNLGRIRKEENALWSLTSHDMSVVMYLLGGMPESVSATGASYLRRDVQDVVFVNLHFPRGVVAHIHASWLDPHKIRQFTVVGEKKMAVFNDMDGSEKLKIYDKGVDRVHDENLYEAFLTLRSGDVHAPQIAMEEPLKLECQAFIDAIRTGRQPMADVDNGIEVLKMLEAAQASLDSAGSLVAVER